jgi:uncharacterized protein (TIGR03437 family)
MRISALVVATLVGTLAWGADPAPPVVVSAASSRIGVTADALASIYGDRLATQAASASTLPWPTSLGDISVVRITDAASQVHMAALFYVSLSQINLWIPPGTAPGPAIFAFPVTGLPLGQGTAALRTVPVDIQKVAPALFSADGTGAGVAAATAIRLVIATNIQSSVPVFRCDAPAACTATPIDVGLDAPVYLTLYGTGIRGGSLVSVVVGTTSVQPTYAGPQPQIPGLDQVNVPLPLSLRGSGLVNVTVSADGVVSNPVQINIQ